MAASTKSAMTKGINAATVEKIELYTSRPISDVAHCAKVASYRHSSHITFQLRVINMENMEIKMKESGGKKKRRGEGDSGEDEDIDKYFGLKDRKSSKKFKRK
ncbi:hypothetical protein TSUD_205850 [Trifolium subterraneum]|uniref:Uncharacterized protein n=1 Tax=Trifolium subterraneum TaxID=3900 RepID=A0A2Z6MTS8_TRISU|nr:hypothetical protein TSUD_205850 [Trifolium subterraneum]